MRPALRLAVAVAVAIAVVATSARADVSAPQAGAIRWRSDVRAAEREAASSKRPLLLFFSAEWCMPCKEMLARSFGDAAVAALVARRFVPLLVDMTNDDDAAKAVSERFHVRALPTLVVVGRGQERLRIDRFTPAAELRAALDRIRP